MRFVTWFQGPSSSRTTHLPHGLGTDTRHDFMIWVKPNERCSKVPGKVNVVVDDVVDVVVVVVLLLLLL